MLSLVLIFSGCSSNNSSQKTNTNTRLENMQNTTKMPQKNNLQNINQTQRPNPQMSNKNFDNNNIQDKPNKDMQPPTR